ncbi:MAG TPA: hypothetical protein VFE82_10920 [Ramlibacter sp.]|jgi:hypothetical protein|uniref:hypothetical protein n=1 Tax=Ramlibacter sp. TaxID=1917967 RepID=UPI002D300F9D|nr:hypothetical protein [Ramlibacter sp.]HZY18984.1 hypothetical protein [Ramlibacter sp.]
MEQAEHPFQPGDRVRHKATGKVMTVLIASRTNLFCGWQEPGREDQSEVVKPGEVEPWADARGRARE